jgi:methylated-DNA-[protein]-cysteine S-methyltransferase
VAFELPLDFGAGFQAQVRRAMAAIPFGETRTYGALAHAIGAPAQAIGQACGANPLPILIPCHRILGAKGLGGFSAKGGVETKVWLLRHEGAAGLLI